MEKPVTALQPNERHTSSARFKSVEWALLWSQNDLRFKGCPVIWFGILPSLKQAPECIAFAFDIDYIYFKLLL